MWIALKTSHKELFNPSVFPVNSVIVLETTYIWFNTNRLAEKKMEEMKYFYDLKKRRPKVKLSVAW